MDGGTSSFLLTVRELRSTESIRFGTKANILEDIYLNTFSIDHTLFFGFSAYSGKH